MPGLFGGSNKQSEIYLRKSLTYNPNSIISHIFLAETLADMGRKDDARKEAQAALDAPLDPNWAPEDRRFKEQAKQLLRKFADMYVNHGGHGEHETILLNVQCR